MLLECTWVHLTYLSFAGHKNVMFIHTYYSNMLEVLSRTHFEAFIDKKKERGQ